MEAWIDGTGILVGFETDNAHITCNGIMSGRHSEEEEDIV
jgi:hypothetical protein